MALMLIARNPSPHEGQLPSVPGKPSTPGPQAWARAANTSSAPVNVLSHTDSSDSRIQDPRAAGQWKHLR